MSPFDNNFFGEDPFEDLIRGFFGASPEISPDIRRYKEKIIKGEEEERIIDFIEDNNKIYLVFELPGYNEKDVLINIKGKELEIKINKKSSEGIQDYLIQKLHQEIFIKKILPKFINTKKFTYTMKNGVLEIIFDKK